jgi:hypothetical protein
MPHRHLLALLVLLLPLLPLDLLAPLHLRFKKVGQVAVNQD